MLTLSLDIFLSAVLVLILLALSHFTQKLSKRKEAQERLGRLRLE